MHLSDFPRSAVLEQIDPDDLIQCKIRVLAKYINNTFSVFLEWWHPDISPSLASNIAEVYNRMLSSILTKPDSVVKDLNFITERDRTQILRWNSIVPDTVERCIHEVIADQVLLRPDSEAVCAWDGSLTFLELDRVASRLAHHLVELGVGPETRVSLCFEKSVIHLRVCFTVFSSLIFCTRNGTLSPCWQC